MLFAGFFGFAVDYTWSGLGGDTNWETPGNWLIPSTPGPGTEVPSDTPNDSLDTAIFPAGAAVTVNLPATLEVGTITANADVTLDGTTTLTVTTINEAGSVTGANVVLSLNNSTVSVVGGVSVASVNATGTTNLSTSITTTGAQTYDGEVTLSGATVINSNGRDVTFSSPVQNGMSGGYADLTINAGAGTITTNGVGSTGDDPPKIGTLILTAATINPNHYVRTTGSQTYNGNIGITVAPSGTQARFNANLETITFNGEFNLTIGATPHSTNIAAGGVTFTKSVSTPISFVERSIELTTATDVTLNNITIEDGVTLTLATNIKIEGSLLTIGAGAITPVSNTITFSGTSSINTTSPLANITVASGILTLDNTLNAADVTITGGILNTGDQSLAASGTLLNAGIFSTTGGTIEATSISGAGAWNLAGLVTTTTGTQTYNGRVTLTGAATLTANDGSTAQTVTFGSTIDSETGANYALAIGSASAVTNVSFGDIVGGNAPLSAISVSGTTTIGANITTTGNQTYAGAVTLASDVNLITPANIAFNSTINGGSSLRIHGDPTNPADPTTLSGTVTFSGVVGDTDSLSSFDIRANAIALNGGAVTTSGFQTYYGDVSTTASALNLSATGSTITFRGDVSESDITLSAGTLAFDSLKDQQIDLSLANLTAFTGAVTINTATHTLTFANGFVQNASAENVSLAGTIETESVPGGLHFTGAVTLVEDTNLTALGDANISFAQNITGTFELSATAPSNTITFGGRAGTNSSPLASLILSAGTITVAGSGASTTGEQTYNGILALTGATSLNAGSGDITFAQSASGDSSLNATTTGTIYINGGTVETVGNQTYDGPVTLGAGTALIAHDGSAAKLVSFTGTVGGNQPLVLGTLNATPMPDKATNVSFSGDATLTSLDVTGTAALNGNITTTGNQTYYGAVISTIATLSLSANTVTFIDNVTTNVLDLSSVITLTLGAGVDKNKTITVTSGLNSFTGAMNINTSNAVSTTFTNGLDTSASVTVRGSVIAGAGQSLEFTGTLGLSGTTTMSAPNNIIFSTSSTLSPTVPLTLNAGNNITFNSEVNATATLTIEDATTVNFNNTFTASDLVFSDTTPATGTAADLAFTPTVAQTINVPSASLSSVTGTIDIIADDTNTLTFTNGFTQNTGGSSVSLQGTINGGASGLSFAGAATLTADTTLTATGGIVALNNTVSGGNTLNIDASTVTLDGTVGGGTPLTALDIDATTSITINQNVSAATQTYDAQTVTLGASTATLTGTVVLPARIAQSFTLGHNVQISEDLNTHTEDYNKITFIIGANTLTVSGALNATYSVPSTPSDELPLVSTGANIEITGNGTFTMGDFDTAAQGTHTVSANGATIRVTDDLWADVGSNSAGLTIHINAPNSTIEINDIVLGIKNGVSGSSSALSITGSEVTINTARAFGDAYTGGNLTVNGSTSVTFTGRVGFNGTTEGYDFESLTVTSPIINLNGNTVTTLGPQTYTGAVHRSTPGAITLVTGEDSTDTLTFSESIGGNITDFSVASHMMHLNKSGDVSVTTTGNQTYNATLASTSDSVKLSTDGGDTITFGKDVSLGTKLLTLEAANLHFTSVSDQEITAHEDSFNTFAGSIQIDTFFTNPDASISEHRLTFTNGFDQQGIGTVSLAGTVNGGESGLIFSGATTLTNTTTLAAIDTTDGSIILNGAITGTQTLNLSANGSGVNGIVQFANNVGASGAPLAAISVTDAEQVIFNQNVYVNTADIANFAVPVTSHVQFRTNNANYAVSIPAKDIELNDELSVEVTNSSNFITFTNGLSKTGVGTVNLAGDIRATNNNLSFEGITTVTADTTLTTQDTTAGEGNISFANAINASAASAQSLILNSSENISFSAAVGGTRFNTIQATAGENILFYASVSADTLTLSASTTLNEGIVFGGNVSSDDLSITSTSDVYITNTSTFAADEGLTDIAEFPKNLFIVTDSATDAVSFSQPLNVTNNFVLFRGAVTFGDTLTTGADVVLFGTKYNGNYTGAPENITGLFRYNPTPARTAARPSLLPANFPTSTPWGGVDIPQETNNPHAFGGSLTSLASKTITVGKNFYANGIDISGGTINIPDNSNATSSFAEAYNLVATGTTVGVKSPGTFAWISAADCTGSAETTDTTAATGWRFDRPQILDNDPDAVKNDPGSGTYTITDDIVRVEFDIPIENSNNEISAAITNNSLKLSTGGDYSTGYAFTGAFTNPEGTTSTDGAGDLSVFYLRVTTPEHRWNTDATGNFVVATDSTDMGRTGAGNTPTNRTTVPNVHIPIALTSLYETLRDTFKNRIATDNHTATADRCPPVLAAVYTGQEVHNAFSSQKEYDAHNFIELHYSEPVNFGDALLDGAGPINNVNIRATNDLGHIANSNAGLTLTGLITTPNGALQTGNKADPGNAFVNALYRNFNFNGGNTTPDQTHRLRVSIAGFVDGSITLTSQTVNNYIGYIDNATTPTGQVTVIANANIKDKSPAQNVLAEGNAFKPTIRTTTVSGLNDDLYSAWDTSPPVFTHGVIDSGAASGSDVGYEIIAVPTAAGDSIDHFEFHLLDNETNTATWARASGWNNNTATRLDTAGGSRANYDHGYTLPAAPATSGGLRVSSLVDMEKALSIVRVDGTAIASGAMIDNNFQRYITDSFFFVGGTQTLAGTSDSLYLSIQPQATNLDPVVKYDITYDDGIGFVTDLAGNRLKTVTVTSADLVSPYITFTLSPYNTKQMLVYFNKSLDLITGGGRATLATIVDEFVFFEKGTSTQITDIDILSASIAFITERSTGIILTFDRAFAKEELFTAYFRPTDIAGDGGTVITGTNGARVNILAESPVSYFGVNTITPVFAQNTLGFNDDLASVAETTIRNFDGSKGLHTYRDITLQARIVATASEFILDGDPKPTLHIDSNPKPLTLSDRYQAETGENITFWLPKPNPDSLVFDPPYSLFSADTNASATEVVHETAGAPSEPLFNFNVTVEDVPRDNNGTMQFLFEWGTVDLPTDARIADTNSPLYHIYLPDPNDIANPGLFSFFLGNNPQRGGTTILNNVINTNVNEEVSLEVIMEEAGNISITVLTLDGNVVKVIGHGRREAGNHYFKWDGKNNSGRTVARGLYWVRVSGPGIDETRKVMVVRD